MGKQYLMAMAVLLTLGCSGGKGADHDAGDATDGGEDVVEELHVTVEPPEPPSPPELTPCPDGWREVEDAETGVTTCDPWPGTGREECGPGEAHFPGEPGCTTVGDPCPTGIWPEGLPTDRDVFYVDASAPDGGDGSRDSPFNDLLIAFRDSGRGSILALAKGTYEDCLIPPPERTLWGACAAATTIDCPDPIDLGGAIFVWENPGIEVRNLTITGERNGIWVTGPGASCTVDGVIVDGAVGGGLHVAGTGEATVRDFVVRDTLPEHADGFFGHGIDVQSAGAATVTRAVVERASNKGIVCAEAGTSLVLEDVAIVGTVEHATRHDSGEGIWVDMGASLEATRVAIEGTRVKALNVIGSTVAISDCVIRDTSGRGSDHIMGYGIAASTSTVDVSRCLVERSTEAGLVYQQSTGTLEDIVVRGTRCQEETGEWGRGINVQTESSVTLHRALLHENRDVGIVVGATATLADVMVISTLPRVSDDTFGQGINVSAGGDMTAERLLLAGNMNAGLVLTEGTAAVTDLEVRDTLPSDSDGLQGFGIGIEARSSLDLTRAHVHHNGEIGIVIENSDATLSHVLVTDTLPRLVTEEWGRGLLVQRASHVQVSSAVFTRNRELSVGAFGEGALVEMQDVSVTDTLLRACAETTCPDDGAGMGVGAYGGAHIAMSGFFVLDSATCGLQMAMGQLPDGTMMTEYGTIELHDGEVSNNPIGVNVHDPTFDVELLMDNVSYHHNDQNLDSTFLPVPDMGEVPEL